MLKFRFNVIRQEEVMVDKICDFYDGKAVITKHNGKWTLYAMSYSKRYNFSGLYKLIDDIYEYIECKDIFLFKKNDGWYFLFFSKAVWNIDSEEVREKRVKGFTKICDNSTNITAVQICSKKDYPMECFYEYVVKTDNGQMFLLGSGNFDVSNHYNDKFIHIYDYEPLKGYEFKFNVIQQEEVMVDNICDLYDGKAVITKYNGKWTLYAMSYSKRHEFRGLYKLIDDIYEYIQLEDVFLFKKNDGWYFLFFSKAVWNIDSEKVREKRVKGFTKICDNSINITAVQICSKKEYPMECFSEYVVKTDNGQMFLLDSGNFNVYDHCNDKCIRIYGYEILKGYNNIAKIYIDAKKSKFVIDALCKPYNFHKFENECSGYTDMGNGYFILQNGENTALIFIEDDILIYKVVDWGHRELIKVCDNDSEGFSEWLIDGCKFRVKGKKINLV